MEAPTYILSVFPFCQFAHVVAFHRQRWGVMVGHGLNEVQAHPPHAEKVTVFPVLHDIGCVSL